jgi:hypothetical protein
VQDWVVRWFAVDVLYRLSVGCSGAWRSGGCSAGCSSPRARKEMRLSEHREGFVALAATFLTYGSTELVQGYGSSRSSWPR